MMSIPEGEGLSDDVLSQQTKSVEELKKMNVDTLKPIAKSYGHTISGKKKQDLIDVIRIGPKKIRRM